MSAMGQKRTSSAQLSWSALCHKQTLFRGECHQFTRRTGGGVQNRTLA